MSKLVLIVDDSTTMRKFVSFSLRMKNFQVLDAEDGMDALEKLSQNRVDLAIVDLNMPVMDGFEFITRVRESSDYANLPVIILSSERSAESIARGKIVGASSYLTKPLNASKVQDQVAKYLGDGEE